MDRAHIAKICAKAYGALHLTHRSISSTSLSLRLSFYLPLVWSKLSYCSQLWIPHIQKEIICFKRVQCRATKLVVNDYTTIYKSRLTSLHLLPLVYLKLWEEQAQLFPVHIDQTLLLQQNCASLECPPPLHQNPNNKLYVGSLHSKFQICGITSQQISILTTHVHTWLCIYIYMVCLCSSCS